MASVGDMSGSRISQYLLLMAVVLMACPVPARPVCELSVHHEDDPCHTRNDSPLSLTASAAEDTPLTDDCCTAGCLDCSLPCCTGIAKIMTSTPKLGTSDCKRVQLLSFSSSISLGDPEPIFHPPRS